MKDYLYYMNMTDEEEERMSLEERLVALVEIQKYSLSLKGKNKKSIRDENIQEYEERE